MFSLVSHNAEWFTCESTGCDISLTTLHQFAYDNRRPFKALSELQGFNEFITIHYLLLW